MVDEAELIENSFAEVAGEAERPGKEEGRRSRQG